MTGRLALTPRPVVQESLHDAVFERVEAHHGKSTTGFQATLGRQQTGLQF